MSETATLPPPAELTPAREMAAASKTRQLGESAEYRAARTALLAEEIALRRQIQRVAGQRRALPPGPVAKDYRFHDEQGRELGLIDLFGVLLMKGGWKSWPVGHRDDRRSCTRK